jgi:hypothetical protein
MPSKKGAVLLVQGGYRYRKNGKPSATYQYWRCINAGCKGNARTSSDFEEGCDMQFSGLKN